MKRRLISFFLAGVLMLSPLQSVPAAQPPDTAAGGNQSITSYTDNIAVNEEEPDLESSQEDNDPIPEAVDDDGIPIPETLDNPDSDVSEAPRADEPTNKESTDPAADDDSDASMSDEAPDGIGMDGGDTPYDSDTSSSKTTKEAADKDEVEEDDVPMTSEAAGMDDEDDAPMGTQTADEEDAPMGADEADTPMTPQADPLEIPFWYAIDGNDQIYNDGTRTFGFELSQAAPYGFTLTPHVGCGEWNDGTGFEMNLAEGDGWSFDPSDYLMTFDGALLSAKGIDRVETRIDLTVGGQTAWTEWRGFDVRDPYVEHRYNFGDEDQLPDWTCWINRHFDCYVENSQYPDGHYFTLEVTDLSIENEDIARCESENEDGYSIRSLNLGTTDYRVSYTDWDGSAGEKVFTISVKNDVYWVDVWPEDGSHRALPQAAKTFHAQAHHESYRPELPDPYHTYSEEELSGLVYTWSLQYFNKEDEAMIGNDLLLLPMEDTHFAEAVLNRAPEEWNGSGLDVLVQVWEEGKEVARAVHYFELSRDYLELWPRLIDGNLMVGGVLPIDCELRRYTYGEDTYSLVEEGVSFTREIYNENAYALEGDDSSFTLRRLDPSNASFRIKAFVNDDNGDPQEVDNVEYWLNEQHFDIWYDIEGNDEIFSDGERTFTLGLGDMGGADYALVPQVGRGEWTAEKGFEHPVLDGWTFDEVTSSITFDGASLKAQGLDRIETRISLRINGLEVSDTWRGFDVIDPEYNYNTDILDGTVLLPDEDRYLSRRGSLFIRNNAYPDGRDLPYIIDELTISSNEDQYDSRGTVAVRPEEDGWSLRVLRYGEAYVHARVTVDPEGDPFPMEKEATLCVSDRRFHMELTIASGGDRVLSGSSATLYPSINYDYRNPETGEHDALDISAYQVTYEVWCSWLNDSIFQKAPYYGSFDLAAKPGEFWSYKEDKAARSVTVSLSEETAPGIDLQVHASLLDPETGDTLCEAWYQLFGGGVSHQLELLDADGEIVEIAPDILPGKDLQVSPRVGVYGLDRENPDAVTDITACNIRDLRFQVNYYPGNGEDDSDPAHFLVFDKNGQAIHDGDEVTPDVFPITIRRNVPWGDLYLRIEARWIENDNDQENSAWARYHFDELSRTRGFISKNGRGNRFNTYYFYYEPLRVEPESAFLEALAARYPELSLTYEIGIYDPETDAIRPILNYGPRDEEGHRGEALGEYDLRGHFDPATGVLEYTEEDLADLEQLQAALALQSDDLGADPYLNLRMKAAAYGYVVFDIIYTVRIISPTVVLSDYEFKMGPGEDQLIPRETIARVDDLDHGGDFYPVIITDVRDEADNPLTDGDLGSILIEEQADGWRVTAKEKGWSGFNVYLEGQDGSVVNNGRPFYLDMEVTDQVLRNERITNAAGETLNEVTLLVDETCVIAPSVDLLTFEETDEGPVVTTTTISPLYETPGYRSEIEYTHYDDRCISIDDEGVVTALREGTTRIFAILRVYTPEDARLVAYLNLLVNVTVVRDTFHIEQNENIFVLPGEEIAFETLLDKVRAFFTVESLKNPAGEELAPHTLFLAEDQSADAFTFTKDALTIREDALPEGETTRDIQVRVGARAGEWFEDYNEITVTIHKHVCSQWTTSKKATVFVAGKKTGKCDHCGQGMSATIKKLTPTIKLSKTSGSIAKKKSATITVTYGNGDSIASVATSNKTIATAKKSGSKVTITAGTKAGKATITVKLKSGKTATYAVTVPKVACTSITAKSSYTVTTKSTIDLGVTLKPALCDSTVTYTSANKKIATVDKNGKVKGVKAGKTTITIKTDNKKTKKVTINVKQGTTAIKTDKTQYTVWKGKTVTIKTTLNPKTSADAITYTSANTKIATVDQKGKVKGVKAGKVAITIKSGTITRKVTVTVK